MKPFQGIRTFMRTGQKQTRKTKVAIIGVPFDGATSNRPGARFGPSSIREASMMLTDGAHPVYAINPTDQMVDLGDVAVSNTDVAKSLSQIEDFYCDLKNVAPLTMGGDHTITLGIIRALALTHSNLRVIHFDAHCDTWADHFGDPYGHGTWVKNVIDEGLVDGKNIISIGVRSCADFDAKTLLCDRGGHNMSVSQFNGHDESNLLENFINDAVRVNAPVYITFDIDAIDPSMCPGTGTPEIAGLTTHAVMRFFNETLKDLWPKIIGGDVVEVSPSYDPTGITSLTAATILHSMASYIVLRG